jgi:hypothetical protein
MASVKGSSWLELDYEVHFGELEIHLMKSPFRQLCINAPDIYADQYVLISL